MLRDTNAANTRVGVLLISCASLSFSTLDSSVKWLMQLHTMTLLEVVWLRFVVHAAIGFAMVAPFQGVEVLRPRKWGLQAVRALLLGVMTTNNFFAMQYLQLTETVSIMFSAPLIVALISHFWLKQHLRVAQWSAIVLGFAGVLFVVRPGSASFHPAMLVMVFNATLYASFNLLTRHMARTEPPEATQWYSALGPALLLAPFALPYASWNHSPLEWGVLLAAGFWGAVGHFLHVRAHSFATAATLAPFNYQQILYMAAWGWVLFGDVPPPPVFLGGCIIIGCGLFLLWEQGRAERASREPSKV